MPNFLDGIPNTPVLSFLDEPDGWPCSASSEEWFAITCRIVKATIADMDLDPAEMAEVEEAFFGAGLLCPASALPPVIRDNAMNGKSGR